MIHEKEFLAKVKVNYPDYDYSNCGFTKLQAPVKVICPKHGEFTKKAFDLYFKRSGCKKCGKEIVSKKLKENAPERFKKARATYKEKTGFENPFENKEIQKQIQQKQVEMYGGMGMGSSVLREKITSTKEELYGNAYYTNREKNTQTVKERYNVDNISQLQEVKDKKKATTKENFGVDYTFQSKECREKAKETNKALYGCENPAQNEEIRRKMYDTLWENGGYHRTEQRCYDRLLEIYPDAIREYKSDEYPFKCDFYVPSEDLYIELNAYWSHGGHYFDKDSPNDLAVIEEWKSKNNDFYNYAIKTWTETDLLKRDTANKNKLNYKVFWTEEDFLAFIIRLGDTYDRGMSNL